MMNRQRLLCLAIIWLGPPAVVALVAILALVIAPRPSAFRDWLELIGYVVGGWVGLLEVATLIFHIQWRDTNCALLARWLQEVATPHTGKRLLSYLSEIAEFFQRAEQSAAMIEAKLLAGEVGLADGMSTQALTQFERARQVAISAGLADLERKSGLSLANSFLRSNDHLKVMAHAKQVLREAKLSPRRAEALILYASACQQLGRTTEALNAYWEAAEEYEMLAEEELLMGESDNPDFIQAKSCYLQAREVWRAVVGARKRPCDDELQAAKSFFERAMRIRLKYASSLEDPSEFELPEYEAYCFQAKEAWWVVAKLAGEPEPHELRQARTYYEKAAEAWKAVQDMADGMLVSSTGAARIPFDTEMLKQLMKHARRRRRSINRIMNRIEIDLQCLERGFEDSSGLS